MSLNHLFANADHTHRLYEETVKTHVSPMDRYRRERAYLVKQMGWSRRNVGHRSVYYIVAALGARAGRQAACGGR